MILQQLYQDAPEILKQARDEELPPAMYDRRPIRWVIPLNLDGKAGDWIPLSGEGKKGARGLLRMVPAAVRTVAITPLLMADKPSYVLGIRPVDPKAPSRRTPEKEAQRTAEEHAAFCGIVDACARETGSAEVEAVNRFLVNWNPQQPEGVPAGLTEGDLITFQVQGRPVVELPAVQRFWASHLRPPAEGESGASLQCLVSGKLGPVEKSSTVMIKGIPGRPVRDRALVSANAPAFESYGLERGETSPICAEASERYAKALNALLESDRHHVTIGALVYAFWSPGGAVEDLPTFLQIKPEPEKVKHLLESYRTGRPWTNFDNAAFHCVALSASGGRAVVRSALDSTVREVGSHLNRWFQLLKLVDSTGETGAPLGLFQLAAAPFREFRDIAADVPRALGEAALEGKPLPESLLHRVLLRIHAERQVTYPRAALIKAVLFQDSTDEEVETMSRLNPTHGPAAYHCGRLLAELESIQRQAIPGIKATITDRFFGSASTAPARAFGPLLSGVQEHLGKLRKDSGRQGAYQGAEKRLEEILSHIREDEGFPRTLNVQEQALFSLGYYHQKADRRKEMHEGAERRKAAKEAGAHSNSPADDTEEEEA